MTREYFPAISVLTIGGCLIAFMVAKGCYEFRGGHLNRFADRMNENLYPIVWEVTDGPHKGRAGKCVSYYPFDYWVTLNVEMTPDELWADWQDAKGRTWRPDDWFKSVTGKRTWITVRKNQVAATDLDQSPPLFSQYDKSKPDIMLAGDYQLIGFRNALYGNPFFYWDAPIPRRYREFFDRGFYCGKRERELFQQRPELDRCKEWGPLKCGEMIRAEEYYAAERRQRELEKCDPGPFQESD